MSLDYVALSTAVVSVVGAVGGIPQLIRWLGTLPHLRIRNVKVYYNPDPKAKGFYIYLENR